MSIESWGWKRIPTYRIFGKIKGKWMKKSFFLVREYSRHPQLKQPSYCVENKGILPLVTKVSRIHRTWRNLKERLGTFECSRGRERGRRSLVSEWMNKKFNSNLFVADLPQLPILFRVTLTGLFDFNFSKRINEFFASGRLTDVCGYTDSFTERPMKYLSRF